MDAAFDRCTDQARRVIRVAGRLAIQHKHERVTVEHLIAAALSERTGRQRSVLREASPKLGEVVDRALAALEAGKRAPSIDALDITVPAKAAVQGRKLARRQYLPYTEVGHLLRAALVQLSDGLRQALNAQQIDVAKLEKALEIATAPFSGPGVDLVRLAQRGELDRVVARGKEIGRLMTILQQRRPILPLLIGDSGVGKTAIVHGLAQRLATRPQPGALQNVRIVTLHTERILADERGGGALEQRIGAVLGEVKRTQSVLFLDDFESFMDSGYAELIAKCVRLVKAAVSGQRVRAIVAMTIPWYRKFVEPNGWLRRRTEVVEVLPLTVSETIMALRANLDRLGERYNVAFEEGLIEEIAALAGRNRGNRRLPGGAMQLLEEVTSRRVMLEDPFATLKFEDLNETIESINLDKEESVANQDFERAAERRDDALRLNIVKEQIVRILREVQADEAPLRIQRSDFEGLAAACGLPPIWLAPFGAPVWDGDECRRLAEEVAGQDAAIRTLLDHLPRLLAVPCAPGKPLGAFLFAGPSGSGKTHVARSLARRLFGDERALVKIEMSRYSSTEDLPRLITDVDAALLRRQSLTGLDPAGRGGVLAFDRADEAAPEALAWLSSWIEGDWRTDMAGWADALPGWLMVMGTRGGIAEVLRDRAKPVVDRERDRVHRHIRADVERHVQGTFAVGLLNRLDDVLYFEPLGPEPLGQILVDRLRELTAMWEPLRVGVKVEDEARDWIVAASEVPELGAWALEWNFERRVQGPLAELLLRSRPEPGSSLVVSLTDESMSVRKLMYSIRRRGIGT